MWAHPRAISTAFGRMMIERGDVTVVHEPFVTLVDHGRVELPDGSAGTMTVDCAGDLLAQLRALGSTRPVFFKDTLEYRYGHLFEHPDEIADITHTFIVRDPADAIASHYAMKPDVTCPEIGYEHQHDLFELAWRATGRRPIVISAERLLADPAAVVSAYCGQVGLRFRPDALSWQPQERAEWQLTRKWHVDAIVSSGFHATKKSYLVTVENNARLRSFDDYHRPFYEQLVAHAV